MILGVKLLKSQKVHKFQNCLKTQIYLNQSKCFRGREVLLDKFNLKKEFNRNMEKEFWNIWWEIDTKKTKIKTILSSKLNLKEKKYQIDKILRISSSVTLNKINTTLILNTERFKFLLSWRGNDKMINITKLTQ